MAFVTVAIANTKGGSTKSTSAVNLAAAGVKKGLRVLLIDFDQQGTASSMSGIYTRCDINLEEHSAALIPGVSDRASKPVTVPASKLALKTAAGYWIVPATAQLYNTEDLIKETTFGDGLVARELSRDKGLKEDFDLVICDTQGAATRLQKAVLIACGNYIIPNLPTQGSVEQLGLILGTVDSINENLFPGISPIELRGHFFSSFVEREIVCRLQDTAMIEKLGTLHLSDCNIPRTTLFEQAAILKQPILDYAADSPAASAYLKLFDNLFPEFS